MRVSNQKLKLLYLMGILLEQTDEEHTITVPQMIDELSRKGISAERKSIYDDMELLRVFGLDICTTKTRTTNYFVASRDFEMPELKLLVDSVQSAKFITHKKSMELISKIEKLTSRQNAKKLHRQVFVANRVKTLNEQIYYNVDKIYEAIAADKQIAFKYFYYDVVRNKIYRKNGEKYVESPVALTWDDENYYLITYKEKYDSFTHYRVDKMDGIDILPQARVMPGDEFDISKYSKGVFSMFGGEETEVSIRFDSDLVGVVFDRFGLDVQMFKEDEEHFTCRVKVAVSPHFLTWLMSFGKKAKVISPDSVAEAMHNFAKEICEIYEV